MNARVSEFGGGIALHGILYGYPRHRFCDRAEEPILRDPEEDVIYSTPQRDTTVIVQEFTSESASDRFQHTASESGVSLAISLKASGWGFGIEANYSRETENNTETSERHSTKSTKASRMHVAIVPIKCFRIIPHKLRLSQSAIADLERVQGDRDKAVRFLEKYGSHVFTGLHHLGGIYYRTVEIDVHETVVTSDIMQACSEEINMGAAIQGSFGVGNSFKVDVATKNRQFRKSEQSSETKTCTCSIKTKTTVRGGSINVSSAEAFAAYVHDHPSEMTIIDRDGIESLMTVWDIVRDNHSDNTALAQPAATIRQTWLDLVSGPMSANPLVQRQISWTMLDNWVVLPSFDNETRSWANFLSRMSTVTKSNAEELVRGMCDRVANLDAQDPKVLNDVIPFHVAALVRTTFFLDYKFAYSLVPENISENWFKIGSFSGSTLRLWGPFLTYYTDILSEQLRKVNPLYSANALSVVLRVFDDNSMKEDILHHFASFLPPERFTADLPFKHFYCVVGIKNMAEKLAIHIRDTYIQSFREDFVALAVDALKNALWLQSPLQYTAILDKTVIDEILRNNVAAVRDAYIHPKAYHERIEYELIKKFAMTNLSTYFARFIQVIKVNILLGVATASQALQCRSYVFHDSLKRGLQHCLAMGASSKLLKMYPPYELKFEDQESILPDKVIAAAIDNVFTWLPICTLDQLRNSLRTVAHVKSVRGLSQIAQNLAAAIQHRGGVSILTDLGVLTDHVLQPHETSSRIVDETFANLGSDLQPEDLRKRLQIVTVLVLVALFAVPIEFASLVCETMFEALPSSALSRTQLESMAGICSIEIQAKLRQRASGLTDHIYPICAIECPICKAPCLKTLFHVSSKENAKHCTVHRPVGLAGWQHEGDNKLCLKTCNEITAFQTMQSGKVISGDQLRDSFKDWQFDHMKEFGWSEDLSKYVSLAFNSQLSMSYPQSQSYIPSPDQLPNFQSIMRRAEL